MTWSDQIFRFRTSLEIWSRWYIDNPDWWRPYFSEMWLEHKYSHSGCHWWNFKFLLLDLKYCQNLHLVVYRSSYLVVPILSNLYKYFANDGLDWSDIQILTPDLDFPENFHLEAFQPSHLVRVKEQAFYQYFAFYNLGWSDIQILAPDMDSPENFASGVHLNHSIW